MKFKRFLLFLLPFFVFLCFFVLFINQDKDKLGSDIITVARNSVQVRSSPTPTLLPLPRSYEIALRTHVFQTFNNCGPATLSMALSYADIQKDQAELGNILRPYQITGGDNDDKSVTLQEVADQAKTYGLNTYLRPNGTPEKLKQFISNDIPVITRTLLKPDEDIGHYRVIRGYDDATNEFIQDDSLQGKNLRYSYDEFNALWQPFNYEYLVLIPHDKKELAERILGDELDEITAWSNAKIRINDEMQYDPENIHLLFALSRIYYYLGDFQKSVEYYNLVEDTMSFRTLWYQIEPLLAIYETGDYERVISISEKILNNQNRAYSELYLLRGKIFQEQGNIDAAKTEFDKALLYNNGFTSKIPQI